MTHQVSEKKDFRSHPHMTMCYEQSKRAHSMQINKVGTSIVCDYIRDNYVQSLKKIN